MDFGKIFSGITGLFRRTPSRETRQTGNGNTYVEKNIHNGTPGWIFLCIVLAFVTGFVLCAYIAHLNIRELSRPRSCKSCAIDINLTEKMLTEIKHDPNIALDVARRSNIDLKRVPDGYFVAFQRIDALLIDIIDNGLGDVVGIRPDISVTNRFNRDIKKYYPELYAMRKSCKELYINQERPGARKIPLTCYPMELAPIFDRFFKNVYQELYQQTYIENLKLDKIKLIQEARAARERKMDV